MTKPFSSGLVAFDFETKGLNVWKGEAEPFLLGLEDEQGNVLKARKGTREWGRALEIMKSPVDKVGWNIKFDLSVAKKEGIEVGGRAHDAMLMCYMNDEYERDLRLKGVGLRHFGREAQEEQFVKSFLSALRRKRKAAAIANGTKYIEPNYSDIPKEKMDTYLEEDLDLTMMAAWKFGHARDGGQRRVYDIESELIPNVVEMEARGVGVDVAYCKKVSAEMGPRLSKLEKKMYELAGVKFNVNSRIQLDSIMRSMGLDTGVESAEDQKGRRIMKTGVNHMRVLKGNDFIDTLMEWRCLHKLDGTYFQSLPELAVDGIVHPSFWPFGQEKGGIKTGRFSCSEPNLQNIPAGQRSDNMELLKDKGLVRRALVPRPGYAFVLGDYAQIEFIIFGCHAGDPKLLEELRKGTDFHLATAYLLFGKDCMDGKTDQQKTRIRFQAKELNFSFMYGMGVDKMALRTGFSIQQARELKARYFNMIPAARDFLLRSQAELLRDQFVQDQFGRRYHVPQEKCYKAANALCQGPAALVMKRGINRVFQQLKGMDAHPVLTIHDELFLEVKKSQVYDAVHALIEGMEDTENFQIPIRVDAAVAEGSWANKKKWKEVADQWKPKRKIVLVR